MSMDFLSGFLLTAVGLAVVIFLIKEAFGGRLSGRRGARRYLADVSARLSGAEAKPVNEHLIGLAGSVIAHSEDGARPMRVRLGAELWSARSDSTEKTRLPVGAPVEVVAVDGLVLVVRAAGEDPSQ